MSNRAMITIGVQHDRGEPLITADGIVLGTVREVEEMIDKYHRQVMMTELEATIIATVQKAATRRMI